MIISCPFCGPRNQTEFVYWHEADTEFPPLHAPLDAWANAVFQRKNPAGRAQEIWHHSLGCRLWLRIDRDTITHKIFSVEAATGLTPDTMETGK